MTIRPSNPKNVPGAPSAHRHHWYPYYAGYSGSFVQDYLEILEPQTPSLLLDPWVGSGTTLVEGARAGLKGVGVDLNPAMVVVSKARLLQRSVSESIRPLARELIGVAQDEDGLDADPLSMWFRSKSTQRWRAIAKAIAKVLVPQDAHDLTKPEHVSRLSSLACFYYVALFRSLRRHLASFGSTNPTWIRVPTDHRRRRSPSWKSISETFLDEVKSLTANMDEEVLFEDDALAPLVTVGDARALPSPSNSADIMITSPPYCTRIDYAMATLPELAVLGFHRDGNFRDLRGSLTGSATIRKTRPTLEKSWGPNCANLLDRVYTHPSKASRGYYLSQFLQYFSDTFGALSEIRRVLKRGGTAVLVVQDSLYKDLHIDLAEIVIEMSEKHNLDLVRRHDYPSSRSMRRLNPAARRYDQRWNPTETALEFVAA